MALIFPLYQPGHSETRIDHTLEQCWVNLFTPSPTPGPTEYLEDFQFKANPTLAVLWFQFYSHPTFTKQQSWAFQNQRFARRISVLANRISMKLRPQVLRRQPGHICPGREAVPKSPGF
ncbi:hypothetical protein CDAR_290321 [Caerostris darwini]|uniref:Uncharacterized protein n=1 Tax=Caerostris darwini TaxID=1538125 RepID=A0AAV4TA79_9ARAC|nr:hypothetical protein CDAR_290321 [Caerostris darwini]